MSRLIVVTSLVALAVSLPMSTLQAQRSGGYSLANIAPHSSADDCWLVIDRGVYVITDYLPEHHGAPDDLVSWCGTDATEKFKEAGKDARKARRAIEDYRIGELARNAH